MKKKLVEGGRRRRASTSRPTINAYYRGRDNAANTSPFESRRPKLNLRKLVVRSIDTLFLIVLGVGIVASLIVNPKSNVRLNDSTYHKKSEYAEFIDTKLGQFKNHNKITFDEIGLEQAITKAFPEVVSTSVELPIFGQKPIINLNVARPAFFIRAGGDEYLLSGNGVAVDLKSYYPKLADLPTIDDDSGFSLSKGKHVLSQQDINFLQSIVAEARYRNVPIKKVVLPKSPEEADLYTNDTGYYTKFFMAGDATNQIGQYLAARNNFKSSEPPSTYLDVRVNGKIFYK